MGTYCQKNGPDKKKHFENNRHKQKEFDIGRRQHADFFDSYF